MTSEVKAEATIRSTGEVIEISLTTPEEVSRAYDLVEDTIKAYRELKYQITNRGMELLKVKEK